MKKTLYIALGMVAMFAFVVGFDLAPGLRAADTTIAANSQGKDANVGGLPVFVTFGSADVGTADSVVVTLPKGFDPDYIHTSVPHTTGSLIIGCEWYKGMGTTETGITIVNAGDRVYSATGTVTVDDVNFDLTFGADCHVDDAPFFGWAARYAQ